MKELKATILEGSCVACGQRTSV